MDLTTARTADGAAAFQPRPGGSCLNVAAGLGRLRVPTALLARISDDHFGDLLRAHLAASGTRLTHALPASDPTTLAAVHLREDGSAAYSFHANGSADRGLRPEHLAALPDGGTLPAGTALHLGSLGLLLEPLASTLDGLIRREAGRRLVSLDPNVRPGLVTDRAAYLRRFAEWVALADMVKASDEDLAWLHLGESYEGVAERWLASGAGLVLITFGSRGAWAAGRYARVYAPARRSGQSTLSERAMPSPPECSPIRTAPADSAAKASTTLAPASLPGCCRTPWRSLPTPAPAPVPSRRTATTA